MTWLYALRLHHDVAIVTLRRSFQLPFHNASCANQIEILAKHPDCFCAVVKFAELRRGQRCWLSECLDLKVDEHTDFILDSSGWGCHHETLTTF